MFVCLIPQGHLTNCASPDPSSNGQEFVIMVIYDSHGTLQPRLTPMRVHGTSEFPYVTIKGANAHVYSSPRRERGDFFLCLTFSRCDYEFVDNAFRTVLGDSRLWVEVATADLFNEVSTHATG